MKKRYEVLIERVKDNKRCKMTGIFKNEEAAIEDLKKVLAVRGYTLHLDWYIVDMKEVGTV